MGIVYTNSGIEKSTSVKMGTELIPFMYIRNSYLSIILRRFSLNIILVNLTPLYKVRTSRYFDRSVAVSPSSHGDMSATCTALDKSFSTATPDQLYAAAIIEPLAIRHIRFCVESRTLLLAGQRHLCLLSFSRNESAYEIPVNIFKINLFT